MGSSADHSAKNMWHLGLITSFGKKISDIKYQVIQYDIRDSKKSTLTCPIICN